MTLIPKGKFITVEGIEGTGKSTNIHFLASLIEAAGYDVLQTREPGGSPIAEQIRQLILDHDQELMPPITELLLFFAARSLHLQNKILPALKEGKWVICDRFADASYAYQGVGRKLGVKRVERLKEWVLDGLEPDLTVLLDAPAEIGMSRAAARGEGDRMDNETLVFYQRVRGAYLELADAHPERFVVIDASLSLDRVQEAISRAMTQFFLNN